MKLPSCTVRADLDGKDLGPRACFGEKVPADAAQALQTKGARASQLIFAATIMP